MKTTCDENENEKENFRDENENLFEHTSCSFCSKMQLHVNRVENLLRISKYHPQTWLQI